MLKRITSKLSIVAGILLVASTPQVYAASVGTGFTYQGRLNLSGSPVNTPQDFQFGLYDASVGGSQVGTTVTQSNVTVTGGLFNVVVDFGSGAFGNSARYIETAVRPAGPGLYTALTPRQAVNPSPIALSVTDNAITTTSISDSAITAAKIGADLKISFRAHMSTSYNGTSTVPFSVVDHNDGNAYDSSQSRFVAPSAGLYRFHVRTYYSGPTSYCRLDVNGSAALSGSSAIIYATSNTGYAYGTETIKLNANDIVTVRKLDTYTLLSTDSMFSGERVY